MNRAPKGRKRQFRKNRCVLVNVRVPFADISANGKIKGTFGGDIRMSLPATGCEHRESILQREHRGAGKAGFVMLMQPGGARHLYDCCRDLLKFFGEEWCLQARFINCRFTVAEVLNKTQQPGVKLNECVKDSFDETTEMWMIEIPYAHMLFDPWWCQWCETTITPDFTSGEKAHTYHSMRRKHTKRERQRHDLPYSKR